MSLVKNEYFGRATFYSAAVANILITEEQVHIM